MIDVVIPVYNHSNYLDVCLAYLRKSTSDYRIIIVDAGSDRETVNFLDSVKDATIIRGDRRLNFAQASNLGIQNSSTDFVALLNTDVIVSEGWLSKLARYLISDDKLVLVSATSNLQREICGYCGYANSTLDGILPNIDNMCTYMSKNNERFRLNYKRRVECYACLMRRNHIIFDEEYNNGFEDYDLCSRLIEKRYRICLAPDVLVYHFGGISREPETGKNEELFEYKRMHIPAVIPMRMGHFLHPEVYRSLSLQSRKIDIYPIVTERLSIDTNENPFGSGYYSQAEARNLGKKIVLQNTDSPFIYFQDCSVVLLDSTAIQQAIKELRSDEQLGVIYFNVHPDFKEELEHFSAASMLQKRIIAEQIDFVSKSASTCFCKQYAESINNLGYKTKYYNDGEVVGYEVTNYGRNL